MSRLELNIWQILTSSIMKTNSNEFRQLITKRESWYRSTLENEFDFSPILSGLYSDSSHFIYEILQNAEDAKATTITFNLLEDKLEITHNGVPFTFKNVESITSIGKSTKAEDITAIGKFGVGFKSVYAITQSPTIRSGDFYFTIKNFVVPIVNVDGQLGYDTSIILPFDHQSQTADQTHSLVRNRLENLGLLTLLFLKNITKIVWNESSSDGQYTRSAVPEYKGFKNVRKAKLESFSSTEEYLVFERPITIAEKELRVEIAYKLELDENNKERIVHSTTSKLFVFLPTNEETYLKFLVQGPFRTTPARDSIPFEDEKNKGLIQEIASLVGDSLPIVRDLGLLDIGFLNILPLKELSASKQEIYKAISITVAERFKSAEPLIPSLQNNHCTAREGMLAGGEDLTQLLNSTDTVLLFKRKEWIAPEARTPDIRDFLRAQLGVPEIDFEDFSKALTTQFLQQKSISWLIEFYKLARKQKSLMRGILRLKPIIRLEDGSHIAPLDPSGKAQVHLPATGERKTHFKTVHKDIIADEEALAFLKELDIKEPDLHDEISEYIIPKYRQTQVVPASDEYFEDVLNLMIGFWQVRSDKKREFVDSLKELRFVLCTKADSLGTVLARPSEVYFLTPELQEYFSGFNDVLFISPELYDRLERADLDQFLRELGVSILPRRIQIQAQLSWDEKKILRGSSGHTRDVHIHDYEIHGLNHFLSNITKERSLLLWNFLLKHVKDFGWQAEKFFKGEYNWFYYSQYRQDFDAKFTRELKDTAWLFDQSDTANKPSSISPSQLSSDYDCNSAASQILIHQLQFKFDVQQQLLHQLPEDDRKKFEVLLSLPSEEFNQMLSLARERVNTSTPLNETQRKESTESTDNPDWNPEVSPDEADISKHPFVPSEQKHLTPADASAADGKEPSEPEEQSNNKSESEKKILTREIGRWGEKYVLRAISDDFKSDGILQETETGARITTHDSRVIDIIWLNIKKERGIGCDFIIKQNGVEIAYIEVKSTSENEHQLFLITGTQWEFARKLFDEEQGDKYWIYCVFNAGKKNCRVETVKNPIKLWKEGKLYAHPINFEFGRSI